MPLLAHWVYSRGERLAFSRHRASRKGILRPLFKLYLQITGKHIREVRISQDGIMLGKTGHIWHRDSLSLELRSEGEVNILAIKMHLHGTHHNGTREIAVPVPKGKLREALEVRERLMKA